MFSENSDLSLVTKRRLANFGLSFQIRQLALFNIVPNLQKPPLKLHSIQLLKPVNDIYLGVEEL